MGNLAVWLIALVIGAVVAGAIFFGVPRLLRRFNQDGGVAVPPTEETLNEEVDVESFPASVKAQGAKSNWQSSKNTSANQGRWGKTTIVAGAVAVAAVAVFSASLSGLFEIGTLNCANAPTQNLVFKIAEQHNALVLAAMSGKGAFTLDDWDQAQANAKVYGKLEDWKQIEASRAEAKNLMKYTLDVIRTTRKDRETGNIACAATLQGDAGKFGTWTLPITYTVERTSDGIPYVTVYGLKN
jgi:hypothetical protein